jgi:hypothetical protein
MCQHAPERCRQGNRLARKRRMVDVAGQARARFLGRHHVEELLLPRRAADRGDEFVRRIIAGAGAG